MPNLNALSYYNITQVSLEALDQDAQAMHQELASTIEYALFHMDTELLEPAAPVNAAQGAHPSQSSLSRFGVLQSPGHQLAICVDSSIDASTAEQYYNNGAHSASGRIQIIHVDHNRSTASIWTANCTGGTCFRRIYSVAEGKGRPYPSYIWESLGVLPVQGNPYVENAMDEAAIISGIARAKQPDVNAGSRLKLLDSTGQIFIHTRHLKVKEGSDPTFVAIIKQIKDVPGLHDVLFEGRAFQQYQLEQAS